MKFMIIQSLLTSLFRRSSFKTSTRQYLSTETPSDVTTGYHIPVLLNECCDYLNIRPGGIYVDCTLGGGGHTKAILERGGRVIGLDQDYDSIKYTSKLLSSYIESNQLEIIQTNFRRINTVVKASRLWQEHIKNMKYVNDQPIHPEEIGVDGVLMDLGISSYQIDYNERGFSFGQDGPLDMRMNQQTPTTPTDGNTDSSTTIISIQNNQQTLTAATIVNTYDQDTIANILYDYGEERRSRVIAREILANRPINSTHQLASIMTKNVPFKQKQQVVARCFQALRIYVNDEIGALEEALQNIHQIIRPSGRLVIMSYHSLEDRRVKNLFRYGQVNGDPDSNDMHQYNDKLAKFMRMSAMYTTGSDQYKYNNNKYENLWLPVVKKALVPSEEEQYHNRRSRSAKLRIGERISRYPQTVLDNLYKDNRKNDKSTNNTTDNNNSNSNSNRKQSVDEDENTEISDITTGSRRNIVKTIKRRQPMMGAKQLAKLQRQKELEEQEEAKEGKE